jgi:hypothetical protein
MAEDYNYNTDESQQGPYKPSQQEWDKAANLLNSYNDRDKGGSINWDTARQAFEGKAAQGGSFNDWVNGAYDSRSSWLSPQQPAQQPAGYQAPANPTSAWNREAFRDASMGRQVGTTAQDFINAHPDISGGVRLVPGSTDKVILPTGEVLDLSINANAQGQGTGNGWTGMGQWNGSAIVPYADGGNGGGGAAGAGGAGSASYSASSSTSNPAITDLLARLKTRADQSLNVSPNDDIIRNQTDAYNAQQQRAERQHLADLAESSGPLANLQGEQRLSSERIGQSTGAFQANLMGRELTARRQEISDALTQMGGLLTEEQRQNLQMQLASMDDAIKRMQLDQNSSQFNADLGYRNAALAQQGTLANNQLGFNMDQFDWQRSPMNPNNFIN